VIGGSNAIPSDATPFSWTSTGLNVPWRVTVTNGQPQFGIQSHAGSNVTIRGPRQPLIMGYWVDGSYGAVDVADLIVPSWPTPLTHSYGEHRLLSLDSVILAADPVTGTPLGWQVYVEPPVTTTGVVIRDSQINELGVQCASPTELRGSWVGWAFVGATGGGPVGLVGCDVDAQYVLATDNAQLYLSDTRIYGSILEGRGSGMVVLGEGTELLPNRSNPSWPIGRAPVMVGNVVVF
jgi:hypothetical protein